MRVMILGGDGQLGSDCTLVLRGSHRVLSVDLPDLDITDLPAVKGVVRNFRPHVMVNCAAFTRVDECETRRDLACRVNVDGPANLAEAAKEGGAILIHVSTDYVFDGRKQVPEAYTEEEIPEPASYYGETKLKAEEAVRRITDDHMIVRTAWLYGIRGHNFLKTMLRLARQDPHREIRVVNDQFGSPTWSYRLALQIVRLIESGGRGTYHATSEGCCTWYELATRFLDTMGIRHFLVPCTTDEYPTPATRPMNSILENRRLKRQGINVMRDWKKDLEEFVSRFRDRLIREADEG
ncbi:MAG: dTDP-4-dehydrorhamnose reductase [Deltaproteobacteria bacterium]|nr:dTDP-4-dehydrorhamnose reductase [Deltaproteobacteria bacterium]